MAEDFICVRAGKGDVTLMADFLKEVWMQMEHKEWFAVEDEAYIDRLMDTGRGIAWKVLERTSGQLAAVCVIDIPGLAEENLGYDAGMEPEELLKVAHMDLSAVSPKFRGNGLQGLMARTAEEELARRGYTRLMCTIHPDNRFSYQTMERMGYRFVRQTCKYGGLLRNIYLKKLSD